MKTQLSSSPRGFSLIEMLATVGMIGILSSVALVTLLQGNESAEQAKLRSQVETLNQALAVYESQGGKLTAGLGERGVISALKTVGDEVSQRSFPGFRGSFVDGRLVTVDMAPGTQGLRAVWDSGRRRFALAETGAGVRFKMQAEVTADYEREEARVTETPGFARESSWVWDFAEAGPEDSRLTSGVPTVDVPGGPSPSYRTQKQLAPPLFSVPGGEYPPSAFPMILTLSNPPENPPGTLIKYSLNSTSWKVYKGKPLALAPDTHVVAYADAAGENGYLSSFATTHYYGEEEEELLAFSGESEGTFRDAVGGSRMKVDYVKNGLDAEFEWGQGVNGYDTGSWLGFESDAFMDVNPESWFRLGGLSYFNSTISMVTQATSVWLDISIDFDTPDLTETFAFGLSLENTLNRSSNTANQNADYVRIQNASSAFSTSLNGEKYELQLQFGYFGSEGFATVDQFHVHEGSRATADLWGYFAPTPRSKNKS